MSKLVVYAVGDLDIVEGDSILVDQVNQEDC
jgi:hypothetical protein